MALPVATPAACPATSHPLNPASGGVFTQGHRLLSAVSGHLTPPPLPHSAPTSLTRFYP